MRPELNIVLLWLRGFIFLCNESALVILQSVKIVNQFNIANMWLEVTRMRTNRSAV